MYFKPLKKINQLKIVYDPSLKTLYIVVYKIKKSKIYEFFGVNFNYEFFGTVICIAEHLNR